MTRVLLLALLIAATAWYENQLYSDHILRFYSWNLSGWDRLLVTWSLVAKTLVLLVIPVAIGYWLNRQGKTFLGWLVPMALSLGVLAWLVLDVKIQATTGQHASYYVSRLFMRQMGGSGKILLTVFAPLLIGATALVVAGIGYRVVRHRLGNNAVEDDQESGASKRGWSAQPDGIALLIAVIVVLGLLVARRRVDHPAVLERLYASLPTSAVLFRVESVSDHGASTFGENVESLFSPLGKRFWEISQLGTTADFSSESEGTRSPPHVVVLILESFRHESITPQRMPRVHRWFNEGVMANRHYSASNCSPQGGFALLFGQLAMCMDSVLDTGEDASLCKMSRAAGMQPSLFASCHFGYRRMDEYFAKPDFDVVELLPVERTQWPQGDIDSIRAIQDRLENATSPQFVVAFLMSTHFDYQYPSEFERMDTDGLIEGTMVTEAGIEQVDQRQYRESYVKSLAFMDDLLGGFVESLDPEEHIVVITGDHGEAIWEDGTLSHGSRLSEIQSRVPMAIRGAGVPQRSIDVPTSHIDLLPTLAGRVGVTIQGEGQQGRDLLQEQDLGPRLLVHEYPDTWDVAIVNEQSDASEEKLLLNIDRESGTTRVLGFVKSAGIVESQSKQNTADAKQWAMRFTRALDRLQTP